jgi:phosphoglycolate phosphatase-like HAD superfamily hydrolase
VVADGQAVDEIPGIQILEATDPVGAGDTVLAVLTALLGSGQRPFIAGRVANIAAAISVKKIQRTGTATPAEILAVGPTPDYIYEPDLAESPNFARYLKGTEIEQVLDLPKNLEIQHCVFDHDGTLSTLREGWEKIMEPMMVQAVLGSRFATADAMLYGKTVDKVRALIDRTTGIQTLMQMKGLTQLVRDAGLVPEDQILDEYGYKHVYNEALLKMVRIRMAKLEKGELDSNDFQIKNAVLLLKELHSRGIKLYLASGTDEADVIAEATAMGYAGLFEGRIFGAVGDINVEAKKMVLERIIREYKLAGHQFATFGDGPVEMRETKKRGGLCIGLASDEVRRYGWNLAKRSRLIRAGADLVAPDFSQLPAMLKTIGVA